MKMDTVAEWDELYKNATAIPPAKVVVDNLHLLPAHGTALDLACGLAENAFLLAEQGLVVDAWDNSAVAIQRVNEKADNTGSTVKASVVDLFDTLLPTNHYNVIVLTHYLEQSISADIVAALKPGGLLFYQTFTREKVSDSGPEDSRYRLKANELSRMFRDLKIIVYREEGCIGDLNRGFRNEALLVAQKVS